MPEVQINIGGREFDVACQEGEEHFLQAAATLLNNEASVLTEQIGRLPEARMLLMAGLMLADKTAGMEEDLKSMQERLAAREAEVDELKNAAGDIEFGERLAALAERAEAVASAVEEKSGSA